VKPGPPWHQGHIASLVSPLARPRLPAAFQGVQIGDERHLHSRLRKPGQRPVGTCREPRRWAACSCLSLLQRGSGALNPAASGQRVLKRHWKEAPSERDFHFRNAWFCSVPLLRLGRPGGCLPLSSTVGLSEGPCVGQTRSNALGSMCAWQDPGADPPGNYAEARGKQRGGW